MAVIFLATICIMAERTRTESFRRCKRQRRQDTRMTCLSKTTTSALLSVSSVMFLTRIASSSCFRILSMITERICVLLMLLSLRKTRSRRLIQSIFAIHTEATATEVIFSSTTMCDTRRLALTKECLSLRLTKRQR